MVSLEKTVDNTSSFVSRYRTKAQRAFAREIMGENPLLLPGIGEASARKLESAGLTTCDVIGAYYICDRNSVAFKKWLIRHMTEEEAADVGGAIQGRFGPKKRGSRFKLLAKQDDMFRFVASGDLPLNIQEVPGLATATLGDINELRRRCIDSLPDGVLGDSQPQDTVLTLAASFFCAKTWKAFTTLLNGLSSDATSTAKGFLTRYPLRKFCVMTPVKVMPDMEYRQFLLENSAVTRPLKKGGIRIPVIK